MRTTKKTMTIVVPDAPLKKGERSLGVMYLQVALQKAMRLTGKNDIVKSEN